MELKDYEDHTYSFNIIVVGCGATGSQFISNLSQLLSYHTDHTLTLIDGDIFEAKNQRNQKCIERDINKHKSQVIAQRYKRAYPDLDIGYQTDYIRNEEQLLELVKAGGKRMPVLISCVDNNATRQIFHNVFHSDKVPQMIYIDSGNGTDNMIGQTVIGYKKVTGKVQCKDSEGSYNNYATRPVSDIILETAGTIFPEILDDKDTIDKVLSCSYHVEEAPQNIGTNITAATMLFNILNNMISFDRLPGHIVYFDAKNLSCVCRE